jgi:hypothetical protein
LPGVPGAEARPAAIAEETLANAEGSPPEGDVRFPQQVEPEVLESESSRKWKVTPHVVLKTGFDDNIFISAQNRQSDFFGVLSPGIAFGLGEFRQHLKEFGSYAQQYEDHPREEAVFFETRRFFFANYTASAIAFVDHSEENAVDHDVSLAGRWTFQKLSLGFRAGLQTLSNSDIDVGGRVKRTITDTEITARYEFSEKTSMEANFSRLGLNYEQALDSTEWKNQNWVNYRVFPKTQLGVGLAVGRLEVDEGAVQSFEQGLVRAHYLGTGKLSFDGELGVEFRQIEDHGGNRTTPIFALGATYSPFVATELSLRGSRRTLASASKAGENYVLTGVEGRIRQRFFQRFYVSTATGYERSAYESVDGRGEANRTDNVFFTRPSLEFDVTKWASMEVAYEFRENDSTNPGSGFTENLATIQISTHY